MSYLDWIRSKVGSRKIFLVFASAIVGDENGRILWQRRGDFGWWGLPGGVLELDETLPQCAVREVKEETGLDVEPTQLVGIYSSPDFDVVYPNGDEVQQVSVCFACRVTGGALRADNAETLALAWRETAPETAVWYRAMVEDWQAGAMPSYKRGRPGNGRSADPYYKMLRRHIGQAPYVAPAAAAVILNHKGHVLLQRRGDTGGWGIPGGGMELGERVDQTVINEVREETGLAVEPVRLVGVYSDEDFWVRYPHGDEAKVASACFLCRVIGGSLRPDGVETLELRYFPPDNLPAMARRHERRIRDALAGKAGV